MSADTTHAARKAIQNALCVPCLGWVWITAEMMIPASAGPQVATNASGANKNWPRFRIAAIGEPQPPGDGEGENSKGGNVVTLDPIGELVHVHSFSARTLLNE